MESQSPTGQTAAELSIKLGNVVFTRARVALIQDGQLITSVRREAVTSLEIGSGSASAHSSREIIFGIIAILGGLIGGASTLASEGLSISSLIGSLVAFAFGIALIHSASGTIKVVRLAGPQGGVVMPVGMEPSAEQIDTFRRRLTDELGYPAPPRPQPRKE